MATVTATDVNGSGVKALTTIVLDGSSDTFTLNSSANVLQLLYLFNPTGGAISPVIVGSTASATYPVVGANTVDLSAGYAVGSIAAGESVLIDTKTIQHYCAGTISMTSASTLEAILIEKTV